VVWRSTADPFAVMEWANDQMISYKRIRAIETIAAVPRNPTGKIDRRLLLKEDVERTRGEGISAP
jgi:acyl-coenzyme A synthetase/AMP-(fatty) acid ligase